VPPPAMTTRMAAGCPRTNRVRNGCPRTGGVRGPFLGPRTWRAWRS